MARDSAIEWTGHTFNPWWGCTKVSPACDHCYAETWARRTGFDIWGANTPRRHLSDDYWSQPLRWDRAAAQSGRRARVFCASMADVFEWNRTLDGLRKRLWKLVDSTPHLDWLLLTKRPHLARRLAPWPSAWPVHVWLGTTVENQHFADRRHPFSARRALSISIPELRAASRTSRPVRLSPRTTLDHRRRGKRRPGTAHASRLDSRTPRPMRERSTSTSITSCWLRSTASTWTCSPDRNTQLTPRIGPSGGFWNGAPRVTLPFVTTRCATSSASRRTGCGILGGTTPRSASMKVMPTSAFTRCWREHRSLRRRRASALSTSVRSNATGLPWKQSHNTKREGYKIELFYFLAQKWLDRAWASTRDGKKLAAWWGNGDHKHFRTLRSVERAIALCKRFRRRTGLCVCGSVRDSRKGSGVTDHVLHDPRIRSSRSGWSHGESVPASSTQRERDRA